MAGGEEQRGAKGGGGGVAPTSPWKLWKSPAAAPLSSVWRRASPGRE